MFNYLYSKIELHNYKTRNFAIARSILALGSTITILFNDPIKLFNPTNIPNPHFESIKFFKISLFFILQNHLIIAKILALIILSLVMIGIYPRITSVFHWWISFSIFSSSFIIEGGDQITQIITFLLIPICLTDSRKNHWFYAETIKNNGFNPIAYFSIILIRLQVAILYFDSSISKLKCTEWVDGTALYYWFTEPFFGLNSFFNFLLYPIYTNNIVLPFLTWSVLLFEFILFLSLTSFFKYHKQILIIGILFHFFIFLFHGLFSFFLAMTGSLLLYLTNFKIIENGPKINMD